MNDTPGSVPQHGRAPLWGPARPASTELTPPPAPAPPSDPGQVPAPASIPPPGQWEFTEQITHDDRTGRISPASIDPDRHGSAPTADLGFPAAAPPPPAMASAPAAHPQPLYPQPPPTAPALDPTRPAAGGTAPRWAMAVVAAFGVGVVVLAVVLVGAIVVTGTGTGFSATSPQAAPPDPSATSPITEVPRPVGVPPAAVQTTPAYDTALVHLEPEAAAHTDAAMVSDLLDRHFTAINTRDYSAWVATVVARRSQDQPVGTWRSNFRSTYDDQVVVRAIRGTGSNLLVDLSFVSQQDIADAPAALPVARICWTSTWPVVGGLLDVPQRGSTSMSAC